MRLPSFSDVLAAHQRLEGVATRTPVATSQTLDRLTGSRAFLKCENFQRMGAFKFRGAYNRMVQLSAQERVAGVVAYSSGNHAQGVALAAQLLAMPATIIMPTDAPESKIEATRGYGAEIIFYERAQGDRHQLAAEVAAQRSATLVPPYDDPEIIAGAGTAAFELFQDAGELDLLLVPTGGGGLLSGSCLSKSGLSPATIVYGVETQAGDDWARSWAKNERIKIPVPTTIADGMQTQMPGELTFPIVREHAAGIVLVSEKEVEHAMRFAFERMKLVVEPSGATALAALLFNKVEHAAKRVGIVISGGNIDAARFARILG